MLFASRQGIPVPQVYFFDSSAKNDYGIEFTIQEFVQGEGLDTNQALIPEAVECWHRLWNSSNFTQSGSLYCHWNRQTFFVGPMVDHELFAPRLEKVGHELPQFGPFTSWKGYVEALFNAKWQRDWTKFYQGSQIISSLPDCPVTASTFLARFTGIQAMTRSASSLVFKPRMVHWDMHERNILVQPDGRQIAAVIDWDAVVIEPAGLCRSIGPACVLDYMSSWEQSGQDWNY
ncbi:hypothetical protein QBC41DRAFT_357033 [Cercophora samala]|uniref:Altered inheritance of mitochondria protein 9, mitochondrial n=1 Tax=Cercophora samala TaxID=330535 RepID=A0AA39ZCM2_9PEZI|nr:hypothetical protein QBC41DRAFT_357033 [Cercophora samala]